MVVGGPGSGKSTVAATLAHQLDAPHVELDELWWGPDWTPAGHTALRTSLIARLEGDRWVVDGNYLDEVADLAWPRADTIVWLDLPRHVGVRRALGRSASRALRRTELWNGNRQSLAVLSPTSVVSLIRRWPSYPMGIERTITELGIEDDAITRLRSDHDVDLWLEGQRS